jgi:NAD(P)H-hydrate epimerase
MLVSKKLAISLIPKRNPGKNKTDFGNLMIIAGNKSFLGAGLLASLAATRSGVGYTHLMAEIPLKERIHFPDFIIHNFNSKILDNKNNYSYAIGPGLGTDIYKKKLFLTLYKNKYKNVVVDADALTILSKLKIKLPSTWILTPHEGEAARLLGISSSAVKKNRSNALQKLHQKYGCLVMLKGPETLVIDGQGEIYEMNFGNHALAKAGTGDVLTGLIGSQLAQGLSPLEAIFVANYLHGEAASRYVKSGKSHRSLRAIDLIEEVSTILKKYD